jgi:hypothetical protein
MREVVVGFRLKVVLVKTYVVITWLNRQDWLVNECGFVLSAAKVRTPAWMSAISFREFVLHDRWHIRRYEQKKTFRIICV